MIRLEKLDAKNVWDILELKVARSQKGFVASNDISIVQAYVAQGTGCSAFPFAICRDHKPVGFLMIGYNEAALYELDGEAPPEALKNNYSIWRLMIGKKYQNRGYGREAIRLALEFIRTWPCWRRNTARSPMSRKTKRPERCIAPAALWKTAKRTGTRPLPC